MNFKLLEKRESPVKQRKYKIVEQGSNVTKAKRELDYEYFLCDCCGNEFKTGNLKWEEREGGILRYPILPNRCIKLAICNGCLRRTIEELELFYRV